jgi:hypothetical protein
MESTKLERMLSALNSENKQREEGLARAKALIDQAKIGPDDNQEDAIRRLGTTAEGSLPGGFDLATGPFGFTLLERLPEAQSMEVTGTVTTNCTFSPWDGCKPDVDF